MTVIYVKPPAMARTRGGFKATIFEIQPEDMRDGLSGIIDTPGMGEIHKCWNDVGICSDSSEDCNLDPNEPDVARQIKRLKEARSNPTSRAPS